MNSWRKSDVIPTIRIQSIDICPYKTWSMNCTSGMSKVKCSHPQINNCFPLSVLCIYICTVNYWMCKLCMSMELPFLFFSFHCNIFNQQMVCGNSLMWWYISNVFPTFCRPHTSERTNDVRGEGKRVNSVRFFPFFLFILKWDVLRTFESI